MESIKTTKRRLHILSIAWTVLCVCAVGSVFMACIVKMWPMVAIQSAITVSTGFMAYVRWKELFDLDDLE
jgi:hypothetical protein